MLEMLPNLNKLDSNRLSRCRDCDTIDTTYQELGDWMLPPGATFRDGVNPVDVIDDESFKCLICHVSLALPAEGFDEESGDSSRILAFQHEYDRLPLLLREMSKPTFLEAAKKETARIRTTDPRRTQIEVLTPGCGHVFHRKCLVEYCGVSNDTRCPACKQQIDGPTFQNLLTEYRQRNEGGNNGGSSSGNNGASSSGRGVLRQRSSSRSPSRSPSPPRSRQRSRSPSPPRANEAEDTAFVAYKNSVFTNVAHFISRWSDLTREYRRSNPLPPQMADQQLSEEQIFNIRRMDEYVYGSNIPFEVRNEIWNTHRHFNSVWVFYNTLSRFPQADDPMLAEWDGAIGRVYLLYRLHLKFAATRRSEDLSEDVRRQESLFGEQLKRMVSELIPLISHVVSRDIETIPHHTSWRAYNDMDGTRNPPNDQIQLVRVSNAEQSFPGSYNQRRDRQNPEKEPIKEAATFYNDTRFSRDGRLDRVDANIVTLLSMVASFETVTFTDRQDRMDDDSPLTTGTDVEDRPEEVLWTSAAIREVFLPLCSGANGAQSEDMKKAAYILTGFVKQHDHSYNHSQFAIYRDNVRDKVIERLAYWTGLVINGRAFNTPISVQDAMASSPLDNQIRDWFRLANRNRPSVTDFTEGTTFLCNYLKETLREFDRTFSRYYTDGNRISRFHSDNHDEFAKLEYLITRIYLLYRLLHRPSGNSLLRAENHQNIFGMMRDALEEMLIVLLPYTLNSTTHSITDGLDMMQSNWIAPYEANDGHDEDEPIVLEKRLYAADLDEATRVLRPSNMDSGIVYQILNIRPLRTRNGATPADKKTYDDMISLYTLMSHAEQAYKRELSGLHHIDLDSKNLENKYVGKAMSPSYIKFRNFLSDERFNESSSKEWPKERLNVQFKNYADMFWRVKAGYTQEQINGELRP